MLTITESSAGANDSSGKNGLRYDEGTTDITTSGSRQAIAALSADALGPRTNQLNHIRAKLWRVWRSRSPYVDSGVAACLHGRLRPRTEKARQRRAPWA